MTLGTALAGVAFVVVRGVLLEPLPFPAGDRLVSIYSRFSPESGYDIPRSALSWPEFLDFQETSHALDVAAFLPRRANLARPGEEPERVPVTSATSHLFGLLGVAPALGSVLDERHDVPGGPCGIVLGDNLWRERFGADPEVVGRSVFVDARPCEVVGVMPRRFDFPNETVRAWVPFPIERDPDGRGSHGVLAVGRLRAEVALAAARDETDALMAGWAERHRHHHGHGLFLLPFAADLVGDVRLPLQIAAVAVGLVVLVMAANVSGLLLAVGESRRRELSVRTALGAGRAQLVRQLMLEGLLVTVAGGAAGTLIAWLSTAALVARYPGTLPRASLVIVDGRAIAVMAAASLAIGLATAALPALRLTGRRRAIALAGAERGSTGTGRRSHLVLVVSEFALTVTVTIGAALLVQSLARLQVTPLGLDADRLFTATVSAGTSGPSAEAIATRFFADLLGRLAAHPAVAEAGAMSSVPLVSRAPGDDFWIEGRPIAQPGDPGFNAQYVMVTPGAIEALGTPLVRGRSIDARDMHVGAPVALVNETLARQYFPREDPVGRRVRYPTGVRDGRWTAWTPWITIVGLVGDVRADGPSDDPRPAIYVSYAQRPRTAYSGVTMGVVVRAHAGAGATAAPAIREAALGADAGATVTATRPLEAVVTSALARPRFMSALMSACAAVTLAIAVVGLYALASFGVASRTREIGVRLALGATRGRVVALAAWHAWPTLAIGLPAGLLGAWMLAQTMTTLLFGVDPWEPATYAAVASGLTMVVGLAVAWPARRAMRVDPVTALRAD